MSVPVARAVVCGIGNEYRGDDGAGIAVARRVVTADPSICLVGPLGEPLDLLGQWDEADLAVVVDAVCSGAPPGTIHVGELCPPPRQEHRRRRPGTASTHGLGVDDVLELARLLGSAPARVVLVGIEGADFSPGRRLAPGVAVAVERAVCLVDALVSEAFRCA